MPRKLTQEEAIAKLEAVYQGKYSLENTVYLGDRLPITITCPIHGDVQVSQAGNAFLKGTGCKFCGKEARAQSTRHDFETRARAAHGDYYDYSKVAYSTLSDKVIIVCPTHGEFLQNAKLHFNGHGCKLCSEKKWDNTTFIRKSREIFGVKFLYDKCAYKGYNKPVTIKCTQHGYFETEASSHITGKHGGCKSCFVESQRMTTVEFIERARGVHGDKYTYDNASYSGVGQDKHVIITCPKHGDFTQHAFNHIKLGQGCPRCVAPVSQPHQKLIDYFSSLDVRFEINDRNVLDKQELDLYFPDHNLAVEVNGVWFHSTYFDRMKKDKLYHQNKYLACKGLGIKLMQFWDFEINDKFPIVVSMISNGLGLARKKIAARKTTVRELDNKEYREFLQANHLQGEVPSHCKLGLVFDNKLVAVLGTTTRGGETTIDRFASLVGHVVQGGFSKLFKASLPAKTVVSFSANRYSSGNLYESFGFKLMRENPVTLYFTNGVNLFSRNQYQKHRLKDFPGYEESKTANEILAENNIFPVYSAGTKRWELSTA